MDDFLVSGAILLLLIFCVLKGFFGERTRTRKRDDPPASRGGWSAWSKQDPDKPQLTEHERLNEEWWQDLRECMGDKKARELEPCLRVLFGGDTQCVFNFRMYAARCGWDCNTPGKIVCFSAPADHYRPRFEILAKTGVAITGLAVGIADRLERQAISTVREIASALDLGKSRSKQELIMRIEATERTRAEAELQARGMGANDSFLLEPGKLRALCRKIAQPTQH